MLDLKFILKNKEVIANNCRQRNVRVDLNLIERLANERVKIIQETEKIRAKINEVAKKVGQCQIESERKKLITKGKSLKKELEEKEKELIIIESSLKTELWKVPNLTHPAVPIGLDDKENKEIKRIGTIKKFPFQPKDHVELGKLLDIIDFEAGVRTTGNKFYFLKNEGVLLELALIQYGLEILTKRGFRPYLTPDLAKLDVIDGIGYNPRGPETQIYKIEGEKLGLIGTAEITLGGLFQNTVISEDELPLKLAGLSHCFRTEAGSYGKASKGLYRVHQFTKLEMFIFSRPEESDKMLDYLVDTEIEIFSGLGIPFRVVDCCTGELGNVAYRKFDLEAWMPKEERWGEITSASNCTDYQARRLNIKFRRSREKKVELVHTLNGTAIAISRTLIAILENFQEADGSVLIPRVIQKWIGKERISPK
jgi:seryl-tRNA synthetase